MKVGDYVRTKDGRISKIYDIQKNDLYILEDYNYSYNSDWLVKSSPNIIDLIEVGDYVNGKKVTKTHLDKSFNPKERILCGDPHFDCLDYMYDNDEIKSIVTKEQFKDMEYKIIK